MQRKMRVFYSCFLWVVFLWVLMFCLLCCCCLSAVLLLMGFVQF